MSGMPKQINELIERFDRNIGSYRNQAYNETQLRREFIDPFFEALGWDVTNRAGYAEAYKDVIHEDAIKIGSATKAPDYCFRIGGVRKFFVETKKPAINVKEDISPAYQLRRYAWSAKLPLSILTDFEEFAVYDCRIKPKPNDKSSIGRILYLTYRDYAARWDEIAAIFSKDAVLRGSFDRFAESRKGKRGTSQVDVEFLIEIEAWRDSLARNLSLRNPDLTVRDLNFAVQRTIDRIIFLRMCEDRGIEPYGQLQSLLNGENIYDRLRYLYGLADDRYNSGLFHFRPEKGRAEAPDGLTQTLTIDDKTLKDLIRRLYYPESPYEFSVLSADILGNVYEQFLGKVIRLTVGHRAIIEEKPEVKKAGGVYYTPSYIVDYIVKNTVGRIVGADLRVRPDMTDTDNKGAHIGGPLQNMTPKQISKIRILDPACGSGSFLIGAYTYLLNYHRDWYVKDGPEKHTKEIYQGPGGQWLLTTQEKRRILLNNIYGVDIDSQAVEVTKLSLLLKVLEGENQETLSKQLMMWRERALPDLGNNIKCGNSLIGPDYWEGRQAGMFDEEEARRVNAFDWKAEFPVIFPSTSGRGKGEGGFDVVIGNPPYVILGSDIFPENILKYLNSYNVAQYKTDLFHLFIQKGIDLLKLNGLLGYITPNTWFTLPFTGRLREYVLRQTNVLELVSFDHNVFHGADVHTGLIFLKRGTELRSSTVKIKLMPHNFHAGILFSMESGTTTQSDWLKDPEFRFEIRRIGGVGKLVERIVKQFPSLEKQARASLGCQAYNRSKHTKEQIEQRIFHSNKKLSPEYFPELSGNDVSRYRINRKKEIWIKYGPWLHDYRTFDWLSGPRLLIREIAGKEPYRICACYEEEIYCNYKTVLNVNPSEATTFSMKYLLGILNSRLISFLYPVVSRKIVSRSFPRLSVKDLKMLPICPIDFSNPIDKTHHDNIVTLVERILDLHKRLKSAKIPDDMTQLQRQIDATDKQIDQLVYELYGLTKEEIGIVEGETTGN